jgi:CubicO group peptidase (beta-lactamase class C family)
VAPWLTVTALAVTLGAPPLRAQTKDSLTTAIGRALSEEGLVGATWSLVTPEGTTVGAAGLKDASRNAPMSPHDRVQVGSIAKTFIATGVLRLVTEGRMALDAPVAQYLPDIPLENPWEAASPLLVRHLLDHSGGLDDARMWQVFSLRARPDAPLREGLVHAGGTVRVRFRPGDRSSYSNTSYVLLGMLIEAVTGMRYEAWLDAELLAPLGMTQSTFAFVTQSGPQGDSTLAMGHFDPGTTSAAVPIHVRPTTQFTTTAADMARFARFLMSDGRVEGRLLVDTLLLRAMAMPTTTEAARAGLAAGPALGLMRRDRHGVVGRCHLGNLGTFRAALCLFPELQRAFFISHNVDPENANFDRIDAMLVRALGVPPSLEQETQPPGVDPVQWEGLYAVRPNRFAQFAYLDELTGLTRVHWDGKALRLSPLQGSARTLAPVGGALFRAEDRREATHVLLHSAEGGPIITDGFRTLERVRPLTVYVRWASALAGLAAILYLLVVGGVRSVQSLRRGMWHWEPLRWPAICLALMLVAPALYFTQSFLAIGDPTPANVAIALLTGMLPFTLLAAIVQRARAGLGTRAARLDLLGLVGALQWCVVLATWGLLPFALWR